MSNGSETTNGDMPDLPATRQRLRRLVLFSSRIAPDPVGDQHDVVTLELSLFPLSGWRVASPAQLARWALSYGDRIPLPVTFAGLRPVPNL